MAELHTAYEPEVPPTDESQLAFYLQTELQRIASAISDAQHADTAKEYVEPTKPREGMVRFADGTNWNPGNGEGLYIYRSGAWARLAFLSEIPASVFATGDAKFTFKTTADTGWVMMNDGSIGSATSGATTRANADTEALFTLLWNNVINTWAPVSGGRGASAAADFAANKTLTLPLQLGRAIAISGTGATLTARALGENLGAETHQLTVAEMPTHSHTYDRAFRAAGDNHGGFVSWTFSWTSTATGTAGSDTPHNNMQPSAFWNVMIKL